MTDADFTIEQVAVVFATTVQILGRMQEGAMDERRPSSAIPRSIMSCDEAMLVVASAMVFAAKLYPDLIDPETLMHALRGAGQPMPTLN